MNVSYTMAEFSLFPSFGDDLAFSTMFSDHERPRNEDPAYEDLAYGDLAYENLGYEYLEYEDVESEDIEYEYPHSLTSSKDELIPDSDLFSLRASCRPEAFSVAQRLYPTERTKYLKRQSEKLIWLPDAEYALHKISCSACHQHESSLYPGRHVSIYSLSEDCHFCKILQKCQRRFGNGCKSMRMFFHGTRTDIQICFQEGTSELSVCKGIHVQLYSKESRSYEEPFPYAKDICENPGSEASIDVMKKWIDRCRITHQHAPLIDGCRPARLIKLAKDEKYGAQLYSPAVPVKYAALSYRWGAGKQSETTKKNVFERSRKLQTSDFPKTLQDAIHVTRGLGLEYIWIDRICIVQDDQEEWAHEAFLMADIYASAYVVLSATSTEDCEDGFLHNRVEPLVIHYTQDSQENCEVRVRRIETHDCMRQRPKTNYTLFKRGWCMQERFLARRIIHFLPDEILFECQVGRECECGAASKESVLIQDSTSCFASLRAAQEIGGLGFAWDWLTILWDYSTMQLTYGEDSLPALSGLAACMEHLKPGKYIAGLWQYDIAPQLGWYLQPKSSIRRWNYPENVDLLGPTFSWSSHVRPMQAQYGGRRDARGICTLDSFEVETATPNPYGKVRHASICLSGRAVSGYDMISRLKASGRVYLDSGFQFNEPFTGRHLADDAKYEELMKEIDWQSVICFGLYEYDEKHPLEVDALLLQLNKSGAQEYVRVGVVQELRKIWFDKYAVATTVTVV